MGRGVRDGDSLDGDVGRGPNVDGIVLVGLFGRNRGIRVVWVRKEVSREGSVSKDPENQVKIEVKLELDPVGSTVRYEMMKLCTMSVHDTLRRKQLVIDDTWSVQGIYAFIYCTKWRSGQVLPMPDGLTDNFER